MSMFDTIRAYAENDVQDAIDAERTIEAWWGLLQEIALARKHLSIAAGFVEDCLIDTMGNSPHGLPDGGTLVVKHTPRSPSADSEGIVRLLVAQARDERRMDPETGEALESEGDAVVRVLAECAPILTPSFSWRWGALKDRIDVDEYRAVKGWSHKVVFQ